MLDDYYSEPSIQVRAYLKRMAASYGDTPAAGRCEEIDALLDALRMRDHWDAPAGLMAMAERYAAAPDAVTPEEIEALLEALGACGPSGGWRFEPD